MKVGLNGRFYGARVTGVQRFAREVARRLIHHVDVTLFLPADVPDTCDVPPDVRRVRGRLPGHLWEQLELPALRSHGDCDVLLHLSPTAPLWGGPNVMTVHDVFPISNPEWFASGFARWYRMSLGPAARRASAVIAMSHWARREIAHWLRVPAERICVVSQGLTPFDAPADEERVVRVLKQLRLERPYVLALGAGDPRKNLGFLNEVVRSWSTLGEVVPSVVVVGEGLARVHGNGRSDPANVVTALGYVSDDDLHALYTGALALCFPSLGEGFGRPPLEAMACGCPVIAADYGAAREILGQAADILPLDPERWVDALRQLRNGTRDGDRRAVAEDHTARFDWDTTAREIAECCRRAAEGSVPDRRSA